jgi:hypothetical protein
LHRFRRRSKPPACSLAFKGSSRKPLKNNDYPIQHRANLWPNSDILPTVDGMPVMPLPQRGGDRMSE